MGLRLSYATLEQAGDRESLLDALLSFAEDYDNDFNGANGMGAHILSAGKTT